MNDGENLIWMYLNRPKKNGDSFSWFGWSKNGEMTEMTQQNEELTQWFQRLNCTWLTTKEIRLYIYILSGWWFQPLWNILYSQLGSLFPIYGKIKKYSKPPASCEMDHNATTRSLASKIIQSMLQRHCLLPREISWPIHQRNDFKQAYSPTIYHWPYRILPEAIHHHVPLNLCYFHPSFQPSS